MSAVRYTVFVRTASVARFVDDVGRIVRDTRDAMGFAQRELSRRSGVSQSEISRIERGLKDDLRIRVVDRLFVALGVRYWLGTEGPNAQRPTADLLHARCSAFVARRLVAAGWLVRREVEVGDRRSHGWIDLVAFHPVSRLLLVVEVKTEIHDIGAIERTLNWYVRGSQDVARGLGWRPVAAVGVLLVLQSRANDHRIAEARDVFRVAFPGRAAELASVVAASRLPTHDRFVAMIDPRSRRAAWLRATRIDGRRTPSPYDDYIDALRLLEARTASRRTR